MCKTYGYCRISRKEQNIDRQERNIKALYPDAIIIKEAYTGTKVEGRKEFEKLIAKADSSTRIVFDSVSRMSRNAEEGFQLYKELFARGVELVFLKEPQIDTETYKSSMERQVSTAIDSGDSATNELITAITEAINRYTMRLAERQIFLAFQQAEKEVEDLHQRTKEGIETARLAGKQIGAVAGRKLNVKKSITAKEQILKYSKDFNGTLTDIEVMKLIGIANNTYYKYKRELKETLNND
uniref:Resolvase/invertase-type recombinase catalytic domain-containing protein n=1 Tax=uncultured prokaryote TaxID=198431 RepID=A0A0H5PW85_9ZZZZ|nr:hypothetical protein [uncultured prokaryote]